MSIVQNLVIDEYGAFLGKHSQRLVVSVKGERKEQAPLLHLQSVLISGGGVSISSDAVRECAGRGIPIHFVSSSGMPYAGLYASGLTATAATRRAQLLAFTDRRGLESAIAFASGKIQNQSILLKYIAKYRKETDPGKFEELRMLANEMRDSLVSLAEIRTFPEVQSGEADTIDHWRPEILGIEGGAARKYWSGIRLVLPESLGWPGREGRGARDPFNMALNYGYGILYGQVERALVLAGLDPYAGFVHVDRPGKPSLTLDLIEEFRQPVVDRTVLGMANKGTRFEQDERGLIAAPARRALAEKILERLEASEPYEKKRYPLRAVIQGQARRLASFLRGDCPAYMPFQASW